jgi:hypothetical protein
METDGDRSAPPCFSLRSNVEVVNSTSLSISILPVTNTAQLGLRGGVYSGRDHAPAVPNGTAGLWYSGGDSSSGGLDHHPIAVAGTAENYAAHQMLTPTTSCSSGFFSTNSKEHLNVKHSAVLSLGPGERGWLPLSLLVPHHPTTTSDCPGGSSHDDEDDDVTPLCAVQVHYVADSSLQKLSAFSYTSQPIKLQTLVRQRAALAASLGAQASVGSVQTLLRLCPSSHREELRPCPSTTDALSNEATSSTSKRVQLPREAEYGYNKKEVPAGYVWSPAISATAQAASSMPDVFLLFSAEPHEHDGVSWVLRLRPPMVLSNALPVPVFVTLLTSITSEHPDDEALPPAWISFCKKKYSSSCTR